MFDKTLIDKKDLLEKCYECVEKKQTITTFNLILLDKQNLKSKSISYSNIKLKKLIEVIYEDAFSTLGKISITSPNSWTTYLILFIDAIRLNKKISEMKIIDISEENGFILFILYSLINQTKSDRIKMALVEDIYNKYYKNKNNFKIKIDYLHDNGYIKILDGYIILKEEIKLV